MFKEILFQNKTGLRSQSGGLLFILFSLFREFYNQVICAPDCLAQISNLPGIADDMNIAARCILLAGQKIHGINHPVAPVYYLGFNNMWADDLGFPSCDDLNQLADGFAGALYDKFFHLPSYFESPCGFLTGKAAEKLGLTAGLPVSTPMGDGNITGLCFCGKHPHAIVSVLGTSVGTSFVMDELIPMSGINGVVWGGYLPEKACYDAGSPCMGDMPDWSIKNQVPQTFPDSFA